MEHVGNGFAVSNRRRGVREVFFKVLGERERQYTAAAGPHALDASAQDASAKRTTTGNLYLEDFVSGAFALEVRERPIRYSIAAAAPAAATETMALRSMRSGSATQVGPGWVPHSSNDSHEIKIRQHLMTIDDR